MEGERANAREEENATIPSSSVLSSCRCFGIMYKWESLSELLCKTSRTTSKFVIAFSFENQAEGLSSRGMRSSRGFSSLLMNRWSRCSKTSSV